MGTSKQDEYVYIYRYMCIYNCIYIYICIKNESGNLMKFHGKIVGTSWYIIKIHQGYRVARRSPRFVKDSPGLKLMCHNETQGTGLAIFGIDRRIVAVNQF